MSAAVDASTKRVLGGMTTNTAATTTAKPAAATPSPAATAVGGNRPAAVAAEDERIRILDRLAQKLFDSRLVEERERLIHELAHQEAELQALRELQQQQQLHLHDQSLLLKSKDATIAQLQQQVSKLQASSATSQSGVESFREQVVALKAELVSASADVAKLRSELQASRAAEATLRAQLHPSTSAAAAATAATSRLLQESLTIDSPAKGSEDEVTIEEVKDSPAKNSDPNLSTIPPSEF